VSFRPSELSSTLLEGLAAFTPGLLGGGDNKDMCVVWSFGSAIAGHIVDSDQKSCCNYCISLLSWSFYFHYIGDYD
jgi:hypothetical protein